MTKRLKSAGLRRELRTPGLIIHYIISVIGVGVLILPGHAAAKAGPLSLVAWAMMIVFSYPMAIIFARLSILHPTSRGVAQFIEYAFGARAARMASAMLVLTLLVGNPVLGLAAARYLLNIWNSDPPTILVLAVGFSIMVGSILFSLLGMKVSTRVQGAVLITLIAFIVTVLAISMPKADASRLEPVAPHGWLSLGEALIIAFFGFIGWENAAPVAEEVVDPQRTYRKAILWAVLAVGALYMGMSVTVVLVLPPGAAGGEQITAFATLLQVVVGPGAAQLGNVVAVVLLLLATNVWVLGTSRVIYSTARDGLLPAVLTKVSRHHRVPFAALLFLIPGYGIPVGLMAITGSDETRLITATSAAFFSIAFGSFLAARRLLRGRAIQLCVIVVIAATVAIIPFFGISLVYASVLLAIAYLLTVRRKAPPENAVADTDTDDSLAA
jgi:amino acid efflux transporter